MTCKAKCNTQRRFCSLQAQRSEWKSCLSCSGISLLVQLPLSPPRQMHTAHPLPGNAWNSAELLGGSEAREVKQTAQPFTDSDVKRPPNRLMNCSVCKADTAKYFKTTKWTMNCFWKVQNAPSSIFKTRFHLYQDFKYQNSTRKQKIRAKYQYN